MATFVLIHGGWHGAWCWERLAPLLRGAGHRVATPTLPGIGERTAELAPSIDLAAHINDVVNLLWAEDLTAVALVGHSYGGMVITGVADRVAERLSRLIYLDAFVPLAGQSLFDLLPPQRRAMYAEQAQVHGEGWRIPPPPATAFGIKGEADLVWVTARLSPQPLATLTQPFRPTRSKMPCLMRSYIQCTDGPLTASFAPFGEYARQSADWTWHALATGHDAMLTMPDALAAILLDLVAS